MTAPAWWGRPPRTAPAAPWARLRAAHPTTVLRWLRAGVIAMVAATALLYVVVSTEAGRQIADARRTERAIGDLSSAYHEADAANQALTRAAATGQVALIGTGGDFDTYTSHVITELTSAAAGNAAGRTGLTQFQFVQGQLITCRQLADAAVLDSSRGAQVGFDAAHHALADRQIVDDGETIPGTGGLMASIDDLKALEAGALEHQRHSRWLDPAYRWSLYTAPVAALLLLVLASGYVVARHFRRPPGPHLGGALLATAVVAATVAVLGGLDERRLAAEPLAGRWWTLAPALLLLAAAAALAYEGYRPRLAEYRFPRS